MDVMKSGEPSWKAGFSDWMDGLDPTQQASPPRLQARAPCAANKLWEKLLRAME